ncbi:uncharacterized protein EHS24_006695 [Apiotrichum porosum]|uniref:glutathione-specific gamma-glutamylcyclotransferase n=1 Tax=Apiotrichum porosum TaxID=105984 RepID=A0A427Y1Z1_9TREE|nr:uncharacterized protein EHS24_006695 [Apiotrichum porosum]RSH85102.1 hypothetical protein EHS24_006695 [Apiotrichum porosum]
MTWIFGYGSIIWRPDFPYAERREGWVVDHTRRFWQGSPDHRGTPSQLGRVVTLVPSEGEICWGVAYRLHLEHEDEVMAYLDHRERGGYVRFDVDFTTAVTPAGTLLQDSTAGDIVRAITYIASPTNDYYLGPVAHPQMVAQISRARGESGKNADYVLNLAKGLLEMGLRDAHVEGLAASLKEVAAKEDVATTVGAPTPLETAKVVA